MTPFLIVTERQVSQPSQSTESVNRVVRDVRTNALTNAVSELRANPSVSERAREKRSIPPDVIAAVKQAAIENAKPLPTIQPDSQEETS